MGSALAAGAAANARRKRAASRRLAMRLDSRRKSSIKSRAEPSIQELRQLSEKKCVVKFLVNFIYNIHGAGYRVNRVPVHKVPVPTRCTVK